MMPRSRFDTTRLCAAGAIAFALVGTLVWTGSAVAKPGSSAATITGAFADGCRDFSSHATKVGSQQGKDISYVEIHYADGRVVKNETVNRPDYSLDGAAGEEIDVAIVKSGTTTESFPCVRENHPPIALLEINSPPVDLTLEHCFYFLGLTCIQSAPRTNWTGSSEVPDVNGVPGVFHWGCDQVLCPFTVTFRGTSSTDPDNDITSWTIDFGDGTSTGGDWRTNPPGEVTHDYTNYFGTCVGVGSSSGICPVTLTVTDAAGQSDSETIPMGFLDLRPD